MGAMYEFLQRLATPAMQAKYVGQDERWNGRAQRLNERLEAAGLPVQVSNLQSIWTISYLQPSRYNWMFQYYLRAEGLALSWVGTGRLIFTMDYSDEDFEAVAARVLAAAARMASEGWWWSAPALTNKAIRRRVLREMLRARRGHAAHATGQSTHPEAGPAALYNKV
jgi:glutamate-1-semialdehyde 2,1-aminomutase